MIVKLSRDGITTSIAKMMKAIFIFNQQNIRSTIKTIMERKVNVVNCICSIGKIVLE